VLASEAAIPLPTNPAALLSLYPLVAALNSNLPTAPVLSVLETAAPSGFLSAIVHDPGYASSFEAQFAAGSSPSWFNGLPTDVRSYLHTYAGYVGVASAVQGAQSLVQSEGLLTNTASASGSAAGAAASSIASVTSGAAAAAGSSSAAAASVVSSVSVAASQSASAAAAGRASSSSSTAMAPRETGFLVIGVAGVAGVLGIVAAL